MEVIEKVPSRRRRRLHASDESLSVQKKKKLDDIQRLELRIQFLSSETKEFKLIRNFRRLLVAFRQHLKVRVLQLHLREQQVSIQHITGIKTLQHIHCRFPASQARFTATSASSSILRTYKGVSLLQTKENGLLVPSMQLHTLKSLEQIC
jgi:hypothetical protein